MAPSQQFDRACQRSSKEDRLGFVSSKGIKENEDKNYFVFGTISCYFSQETEKKNATKRRKNCNQLFS